MTPPDAREAIVAAKRFLGELPVPSSSRRGYVLPDFAG